MKGGVWLIEANSVGTPVIAYNSAGLVDSVKDGFSGIIVKENSPFSLANEVNNLLLDGVKYKKMQKTSISWSKNFNWEKSRFQSLQLISQIYES